MLPAEDGRRRRPGRRAGLEYEEKVLTDSTHIADRRLRLRSSMATRTNPPRQQTAVGLNTSLVGRAIVVEPLPAVSAAVVLS